jgi:hypothetical protein
VTGCRWKALTAGAAATARCCAITGVVMLVGEGELLVMELSAVMSPATALSHNVAARRIATRRWPLPQLPAPPADQSETRTDGPSQQTPSHIHPAWLLTDAELCHAWRIRSRAQAARTGVLFAGLQRPDERTCLVGDTGGTHRAVASYWLGSLAGCRSAASHR